MMMTDRGLAEPGSGTTRLTWSSYSWVDKSSASPKSVTHFATFSYTMLRIVMMMKLTMEAVMEVVIRGDTDTPN